MQLDCTVQKQPPFAAEDWIKADFHIHTLDDPKDHLDYSAHQLLERARDLGFGVLAITLHGKVFGRAEVFADAAAMGILLIPAIELRLEGCDVVVLNVQPEDVRDVRTFADLRRLRAQQGDSIFCFAPHPFFVLGASLGQRLIEEIDCFDAVEICHFHKGFFDRNRRAREVAAQFGKPLVATSDAHRLESFGFHYTSFPSPAELTVPGVLAALRRGPLRLTSPPASWRDLLMVFYFVFLLHPVRRRWRERRRRRFLHRLEEERARLRAS